MKFPSQMFVSLETIASPFAYQTILKLHRVVKVLFRLYYLLRNFDRQCLFCILVHVCTNGFKTSLLSGPRKEGQ